MLSYLAILFPCILCGLWFLVFATRFTKSVEFQHLTILAGLTAAFFFVDACYCMNGLSSRTIIAADILKQFISPCMGLYCWYYFSALKKKTKTPSFTGYLIAIPTFLMAVAATTYLIMGYHDADLFIRAWEAQGHYPDGFDETIFQLNKFICVDCYNAFEIAIVSGLLIYLVRDLFKTGYTFSESTGALFRKERVSIHHIQCIHFIHFLIVFGIKIILGRGYLLSHPVISTLLFVYLGIIVLLICAAGIMGTAENVTLGRVYFGITDKELPAAEEKKEESVAEVEDNDNANEAAEDVSDESEDNDDEDYVEDNMGDDGIDDEEPDQTPGYHVSTIKYDESLVDRFKVAVVEKKLYLKNGLTIRDVCEELGSNKTYISKMVNERFGMPFPNYINMLRVDYAKQYLLDHPDAKQEEIADECGFPNAAGFNRSFKKETGTTPRIWLAKNLKK